MLEGTALDQLTKAPDMAGQFYTVGGKPVSRTEAELCVKIWMIPHWGNTPERWDFRTTEKSSVVRLFAKGLFTICS